MGWKGVGVETRSEDGPGQTPFLKIGPPFLKSNISGSPRDVFPCE